MSEKITRERAIELLCAKELTILSSQARESILLDWWSIDETEPEFMVLSASLQKEMRESEEPKDSLNPKYDPLILMGLKYKYRGVRNEYIDKRLVDLELGDFQVVGEPEYLFECPCCHYFTLEGRGQYDICPVCFWEDTGQTANPDKYSTPNQMSLSQARSNFVQLGAISIEAQKYVDPDGTKKWIKAIK